jgi:hypothetical protein
MVGRAGGGGVAQAGPNPSIARRGQKSSACTHLEIDFHVGEDQGLAIGGAQGAEHVLHGRRHEARAGEGEEDTVYVCV